jgi:hypothetical protein
MALSVIEVAVKVVHTDEWGERYGFRSIES